MDRDRAIEEIRRAADMRDYLTPAGGANTYICPFCGSGSHGHGSSAAFHYYPDTNTAACFSTACTEGMSTGKSYDVFDVVQKYYNTDFNGALEILADKTGIEIDGNYTGSPTQRRLEAEYERSRGIQNAAETATDHTAYYKECADRITDPRAVSYLTGRGISIETAQRYGLGFDPGADPAESGHPSPRIIIPISPGHYVARSIDPNTPKQYAKMNNKGATIDIYNAQCLHDGDPRPVFVTEGVFDALAVQEAGYKAIALNSANNAGRLVKKMREQPPTGVTYFVVCLDNDDAGRTSTRTLMSGLQCYTTADISAPYKDPNEHLQHDRNSFLSAVKSAASLPTAPPPQQPAQSAETADIMGDYFRMCGINPRTASERGASYDTAGGQIVIPCEDTATYKIPAFKNGRAEYAASSIAKPFGLAEALRGRDQEENRPIFVVWNPVDALALIEDDYRAVALCNYTAADYFISRVCEARPKEPIVLSVTGDTRDRIRAHLATAGLTVYTTDLQGSYDNIWQHRLHNREAYKAAADAAGKGEPTGVSDYIATALVDDIEEFKTDIKTGFENFDRETGGLYSGLYVVGAISSLGKTTFVHQLADQIAERKGHVLFFSLEQSRFELVTKSIARESYLLDAWSAYSAMDVRRMRGKMDERTATIMSQYAGKVENRLQIIESTFDCTAGQIEQTAREYMARNKVTPVIIVDYLQVLQPEPNAAQTDIRSTVDAALTRFKRLAADTGAPVIVVSSINRQNYSAPIDFSGFKESGGIEYTADCVIGLQLEVMNAKLFTQDKKEINKRTLAEVAKKQIPRRIEAKILKNRYGATRFSVYFEYNPVFDCFAPCDPMSAAELTALEKEAEKLIKERADAAARAEQAEAITL